MEARTCQNSLAIGLEYLSFFFPSPCLVHELVYKKQGMSWLRSVLMMRNLAGDVLGNSLQPYESHIFFVIQFVACITYGLLNLNYYALRASLLWKMLQFMVGLFPLQCSRLSVDPKRKGDANLVIGQNKTLCGKKGDGAVYAVYFHSTLALNSVSPLDHSSQGAKKWISALAHASPDPGH
ncbi:hypothetical protein K1719_040063 [Acacia pycnantha]|nr:hypothetical protein K1719_040063 [Acacia pycnantha]